MLNAFSKYYHTIKYLRWPQIKYRLRYTLQKAPNPQRLRQRFPLSQKPLPLALTDSISSSSSWLGGQQFRFLNISHDFEERGIDWNYNLYGKLWTYNLNYFAFLLQTDITKEKGLELIHHFIEHESKIRDGMDPYPISLRLIYWITFLSKHQISDEIIDRSLWGQLQLLSARPEYHLMGNHLLENGFGLLFGACYFRVNTLLEQAQEILMTELEEQVLEDGAHFELSPMYHQILLGRVLDGVNLLEHGLKEHSATHEPAHLFSDGFAKPDVKLLLLLQSKAALMLGWLQQITFSNGDLPHVNDATAGIAPDNEALFDYARRLGIMPKQIPLKSCGYRLHKGENYEAFIDVGNIGPDYIPGHAHSDTFNFVLYHRGRPLIVDTGISTYEKNEQRHTERATAAHNTVMVDGREQSEVWSGFRVARRAKVTELQETEQEITATHDGYKMLGCLHTRRYSFGSKHLVITDLLTGDHEGKAFLHFHPEVAIQLQGQQISGSFGAIDFSEHAMVDVAPYDLAIGFNQTRRSTKAIITFTNELQTKLTLS